MQNLRFPHHLVLCHFFVKQSWQLLEIWVNWVYWILNKISQFLNYVFVNGGLLLLVISDDFDHFLKYFWIPVHERTVVNNRHLLPPTANIIHCRTRVLLQYVGHIKDSSGYVQIHLFLWGLHRLVFHSFWLVIKVFKL